MRFLVDENLPNAIVEALTKQGFDAVKVASGSLDEQVAAFAQKTERVLLTLDKDFANILLYPPREYHGIVCFRLNRPLVKDILQGLGSVLSHFKSDSVRGRLIIVASHGFRIR